MGRLLHPAVLVGFYFMWRVLDPPRYSFDFIIHIGTQADVFVRARGDNPRRGLPAAIPGSGAVRDSAAGQVLFFLLVFLWLCCAMSASFCWLFFLFGFFVF